MRIEVYLHLIPIIAMFEMQCPYSKAQRKSSMGSITRVCLQLRSFFIVMGQWPEGTMTRSDSVLDGSPEDLDLPTFPS